MPLVVFLKKLPGIACYLLGNIGRYVDPVLSCKAVKPVIPNTYTYNIPDEMLATDPCLVYLVLTSESLENKDERQEWFDMYDLMNKDEITNLYDILYRERNKLDELRGKTE